MPTHPANSCILILDFGSQYTEMIARILRECGVYTTILPAHADPAQWDALKPVGIVLSGGPQSVRAENSLRAPDRVFDYGVPVLGICYGMQTMAVQLGGAVASGPVHEFGAATVTVDLDDPLLGAWARLQGQMPCTVWMSHGDAVTALPPGFGTSAHNAHTPIAAMSDPIRRFYGVQFHAEVMHTPHGKTLFDTFASICGAERAWKTEYVLEELLQSIRQTVGNERVLLGLSGGVDSSVLAVLLQRAIGSQLVCVCVDHGLMRLHEAETVQQTLSEYGIHLEIVNAHSAFFNALQGVSDPETKRKIIGRLFIETFEQKAQTLGPIGFLAQGTIYSDVIESAGSGSAKALIKSHHNVAGLPERLPFSLLEPLRQLFKDEVRQLGALLGLPQSWIQRHPFPGPGLGVRVLGEVTPERVAILQQVDAIFTEMLIDSGWYEKTSQAFAVSLPVCSVAVKGDARHYESVVALRAVSTSDFMTAHVTHFPPAFLDAVSTRIINSVRGVSRVVYDISSKPPATIEWE